MGIYNDKMMHTGKKQFFNNIRRSLQLVLFFLFIFLSGYLPAQDCEKLTVDAKVKNASCGVNNDGAIHLSVQGGMAPYTYQWSDGSKLKDLTGIASGDYSVLVSDAGGCQLALNYTITVNIPLNVDFSIQAPTYQYAGNGKIYLKVNGGVAPFTFFVNDYSDIRNIKRYSTTQSHLDELNAGNYLIDVKDARGCTATLNINLTSQNK